VLGSSILRRDLLRLRRPNSEAIGATRVLSGGPIEATLVLSQVAMTAPLDQGGWPW